MCGFFFKGHSTPFLRLAHKSAPALPHGPVLYPGDNGADALKAHALCQPQAPVRSQLPADVLLWKQPDGISDAVLLVHILNLLVFLPIKHRLFPEVRQSEIGAPVCSAAVRYEKGAEVKRQAGKKCQSLSSYWIRKSGMTAPCVTLSIISAPGCSKDFL